jgi:hypothetical protein
VYSQLVLKDNCKKKIKKINCTLPPPLFNKVAMMSRITIHLKRAGDRARDYTSFNSPNSLFFNHEPRRPSSTQFWNHQFDTSMPDQTSLPPSPINDGAEPVSTAVNHNPVNKPPPVVVARPKISDIQIV